MKRKIFTLTYSSDSDSSGEGVVVTHLREAFHMIGLKRENVQILIISLNSWSVRKMQQGFQASNYMSQTAKKLVAERGNFVKPALCLLPQHLK
jgi:hypothetical protein